MAEKRNNHLEKIRNLLLNTWKGVRKIIFDNIYGSIVFLVFVSFIIYIPLLSLNAKMSNDEGGYMYIAKKILDGAIPYKDYFDHKPPGIYYLFALSFLIFGKSLLAGRLTVFVFNIGTAVVLYFIGRSIKKPTMGQVAGVLYLIAALTPQYFGSRGITEPFLTFFAALCLLYYIRSNDGNKTYLIILSGICLGFATLFKQSAFLLLIGFYIFFILGLRIKTNRNYSYLKKRFRIAVLITIGTGIVWIPVLIYFYLQGALSDMIYAVFFFTEEYLGYSYSIGPVFNEIWNCFYIYSFAFIMALAGTILIIYEFIFKKRYNYNLLVVILWLSLMPQLAYFQFAQYFLTFFLFFSLIAADVVISIYKHLKNCYQKRKTLALDMKRWDSISIINMLIIFFIVFLLIASHASISATYTNGRYITKSGASSPLKEYIQHRTSPNEKIFVFGPAQYYFELDRDPPTKYIWLYRYTATDEIQKQTIDNIESKHVRYVVVSYLLIYSNGKSKYASTLYEYIQSNYKYDCYLENCYVYSRLTEWKVPI